ncbi:MAG: pyridoxamine 5'-phosphate oxidase family protein [Acidimicrobiia bacterium]
MSPWQLFVDQAGPLAELAQTRLIGRVAYLATVRPDGGPRVHPVTPRVHDRRLFVRMHPSSPKVADLRRDPRFALHSQVDNTEGSGGEISVSGTAVIVQDAAWIENAFDGLPDPDPQRYVVFELDLDDVKVTLYEGGDTIRRRWRADG